MIKLFLNNIEADISQDIDIAMTYEMNDLSNPQAVKNSYSKSITLEGTPTNNKIFGNIYQFDKDIKEDTSSIGSNFNPLKRVPFYLQLDGDTIESGYFQLTSISRKGDRIQYEIELLGGLGDFFYNLMYDETDTEINLSKLYYGWEKEGSTVAMTPEEENKTNLFEYDREFINKCWYRRCKDTSIIDGKQHIDYLQSLYSTFCPVPLYQGLYDNFSNDKIIEYERGTYIDWKVEDNDKSYYGYPNAAIVGGTNKSAYPTVAARDITEFESGDIRSHNQRLGMRLKAIYEAIKNPFNNGGYQVDDTQIDYKVKNFINDGYILLPQFDFETINDTNKYYDLSFGTSPLTIGSSSYKGTSVNTNTSTFDVSDFINPHATVTVTPSLNCGGNSGSTLSTSGVYRIKVHSELAADQGWGGPFVYDSGIRPLAYNDIQAYYVVALDANGNQVAMSDAKILYNKDNIDNNIVLTCPYSRCQNYIDVDLDNVIYTNGYTSGQIQQESLRTALGELSNYLPNGIVWNFEISSKYADNDEHYYRHNTGVNALSNSQFVGVENITFNMELPSTAKQLKVYCVNFHWRKIVEFDKNKNIYYRDLNSSDMMGVNYELNSNWYDNYSLARLDNGFVWYDVMGYINGGGSDDTQICQVYDGSIVANTKRHVLNKTQLLSETNTPFDYLIGMGKMFNLIFRKDIVEKKIYIYSKYNFYDKEIINITNDIDRNEITITPTPIEYSKYRIGLQIPETYQAELFKKKNNKEYGIELYKSGYNFNAEENDILEDVELKMLVPYTEHSIFFTTSDSIAVAAMGNRFTEILFNTASTDLDTTEVDKRGALDIANSGVQNNNDTNERLCIFDSEISNVDDCNNAFILYNGYEDRTNKKKLWLSDYYPMISTISGDDDCFVKTNGYAVKVNNGDVTYEVKQNLIDYLPLFNNKSVNNKISLTFDNSNSDCDNLWNLYFKNDITNIYNKNSKVMETKMKIKGNPNDLMRHYYYFDNSVWILNKVEDWNPNMKSYTKVEFIKLTDYNNYCKPIVNS